MDLRLHIDPRTLAWLVERNITVHVAQTRAAVALYIELLTTTPVGGLFHSTC